MKNLFLLVSIFFLATTFSSNPPPGWYQQQLPVSVKINDIFFLDSLIGWIVTDSKNVSTDTSFIMRTTNGGINWGINYSTFVDFTAIQFVNTNTGYACGISSGPDLFKSTNGGVNWETIGALGFTWKSDLIFINNDTGWVCSSDAFDGGVFKTINGGLNWLQQLNIGLGNPSKIFFVNKDTGWFSNTHGEVYKTLNSGLNWNLQHSFGSDNSIKNIFFVNKDSGWILTTGEDQVHYTSNGGSNWFLQMLPPKGGIIVSSRAEGISSKDGKVAWCVGGGAFLGMGRFRGLIFKTTNSGYNWFYQLPDTSINIPIYTNVYFVNDSIGWAAYTGLIHTTDGGGTIVNLNNHSFEIPKKFILYQNYPNPFNPVTIINYELRITSHVKLKVFDIQGKEIKILADEMQSAGNYETEFDGS